MRGSSKLTEQQVQEIKRLFATTMLCDGDIAEMYGVSRPHINAIRHGKHYSDVLDYMRGLTTTHTLIGGYDYSSGVRPVETNYGVKYLIIHTLIGGYDYSSGVRPVETNYGVKYLIIHYINQDVFHECSNLYDKVPDYDTLRERHDLFVKRFFYSNKKS